jgi:hypothetical protein
MFPPLSNSYSLIVLIPKVAKMAEVLLACVGKMK